MPLINMVTPFAPGHWVDAAFPDSAGRDRANHPPQRLESVA
jgi:hypothetical protein